MKYLGWKNYKELEKGDILCVDGIYRRIKEIKTTNKTTSINFGDIKKRVKNIETKRFKVFEETNRIFTEYEMKMIHYLNQKGFDKKWLESLSKCELEELCSW